MSILLVRAEGHSLRNLHPYLRLDNLQVSVVHDLVILSNAGNNLWQILSTSQVATGQLSEP